MAPDDQEFGELESDEAGSPRDQDAPQWIRLVCIPLLTVLAHVPSCTF